MRDSFVTAADPAPHLTQTDAAAAADDAPAGALERGRGVALWRQIESVLEQDIVAGTIAADGRMPTEHDLVRRFGVNRHTVRRALGGLQDRGLIRIEQGRGSFLQENVVDYALGRRVRFGEILSRQQRSGRGRLLRSVEAPADQTVAAALNLRLGDTVVVLETVGESDGQRLCVTSHYFEAARFAGIAEVFAEQGSITAALAHYGIRDFERRSTRVTARLPSPEDARYLHQPKTRPVLVTEAINVAPDGTPVEYGLSRFASDRVQLVVEL